ncbi:MAG: TIGR04283 family arsenosugar biosynthesis glycosyltransferase, partial [Dehalococcoidales bacterium]|nr:TIGR04283 family arsenosugar biosynthesis glycosyltransferase [Dehalococcoidales bacterium]
LNEARILETALRQMITLKGDFEVIVVDGGSTDSTMSIAGRFVRVLSSPKGRSTQMNLGAKAAGGNVLLFLHADTRLPEGAFRAIAESMNDPAVIGGRFKIRLDEQGWQYRMVGSSINLRDRFFNGFTGDQAIFIRKSVFETLGGYRDIPLMEDLDLGRRMCRYGKVVRLPLSVVTSARRWKNNGVFRTILLMWALRLGYLLGRPPRRFFRLYGDTR